MVQRRNAPTQLGLPVVALSDVNALRAYAHPLRLRLVALLRRRGELTASQAAAELGESSGSTSFHLRQLAKYGLVEEAGGGSGRSKPWRATARLTHIPEVAATPEEAEASSAVRSLIAAGYHERLAAWIARSASEPPRWQQASMMTDVTLLATPAELTELKEAISALLAPLVQRAEQTPSRNSRRRPVTFIGVAFPDE